jgi:hypothetical protein
MSAATSHRNDSFRDLPPVLEVSADAVRADLASLVPSAEATEVFAELARLCVPKYCDACLISIVDDRDQARVIRWPHPDARLDGAIGPASRPRPRPAASAEPLPGAPSEAIRIPIVGLEDGHRGELVLGFDRRRPSDGHALLGQVLVERAVALITRQQQAASAAAAADRASNLEIALESSREIGMAMGIVMDRHKLSADQAFNLLSRISQHGRRKVREVARDIAETGAFELPPNVELISGRSSVAPAR